LVNLKEITMSHELTTRADGSVEFAYLASDGTPWHGLGQALEDGTSLDAWREAAGMDWRIKRGIVRFNTDTLGNQADLPDQHVLFRSDTKAPLGVVSSKYKVVQPDEVIEFFRDIARAGGLELSAAGTIYGGKRFWATAKIGESSPTSVRDTIGGYILISTSADGSLATEVRRTTVRAVCKNTLAMAFGSQAAVKVSHRSVFDPEQVKDFMGLNTAAWDSFRANVTRLANLPVIQDEAEDILAKIFGGNESAGFKRTLGLFNGEGMGATLDGVMGTRWGLLNAVTEYADHHVRARTDENRFVASQWGAGADLKQRALAALLPA
jgi:phage/plasmid-like protein (TIGR03299 family)